MILTGQEIRRQLGESIFIEPFDEANLNPNSVNLRLHAELMVYEELVLDMKKPSRVSRVSIPPEGFVMTPHQLYLGRTVEYTETRSLVPMIAGRSSIGRLGLLVTSGFGNVGFKGHWTLQLLAVRPVRIYAGVPICQIFYHTLSGEFTEYASEKYQDNRDIQPSLLFKELAPERDPQMLLHFFGQERPS